MAIALAAGVMSIVANKSIFFILDSFYLWLILLFRGKNALFYCA